jgi:hypothetical protein
MHQSVQALFFGLDMVDVTIWDNVCRENQSRQLHFNLAPWQWHHAPVDVQAQLEAAAKAAKALAAEAKLAETRLVAAKAAEEKVEELRIKQAKAAEELVAKMVKLVIL